MKKEKSIYREYIEALVTALVLALIIRTFVVQAFKIPSGSMIPTLQIGDHILVNKFIYGVQIPFTDKKIFVFNHPQRGDIVVFKFPQDPSRDFIKRVIAKGGDTVEIVNREVYVNKKKLDEPYIQHTDSIDTKDMLPRDVMSPVTVPINKIFVMGDNRDHSYDSRFWGFVDLSAVRGEALFVYWSWDKDKTSVRFRRIGRTIK
ncbi:signal peptidase I [Candidatus Magnetomonas plexicatena]|uniref:signal peptidase I n=1 Tax=Candidatus Magnetomonas plexicatena TaxID=2552947 RepID=UPI001C741033|nr:signal peptidase I [Nitrospirales bacterium LBB_01]